MAQKETANLSETRDTQAHGNPSQFRRDYRSFYRDQNVEGYNMEGMQTTFFDPPMPIRGSNPYARAQFYYDLSYSGKMIDVCMWLYFVLVAVVILGLSTALLIELFSSLKAVQVHGVQVGVSESKDIPSFQDRRGLTIGDLALFFILAIAVVSYFICCGVGQALKASDPDKIEQIAEY